MLSQTLQPWIDQWLSGQTRRWHLRFPPALEAAFERQTGAARSQTLALLVGAGCAAFLAWDITGGTSGISRYGRALHAVLVAGPELVAFMALRRGLPAWPREIVITLLVICSGLGLSALYASGDWPSAAMCNTGVIINLLSGALVLQLRAPFNLGATLIMVAAQVAALLYRQADKAGAATAYCEVMLISAGIAVFANWRQERETRRTFLLGLKETLGRQELTQHNRELDDLARRDPLTGLPNRRAFDSWLRTLPSDTEAGAAHPVSLIAIDVDHFKLYNDHYGHPEGDRCLRQVAACLREHTRGATDLVARIGGEEFSVLLTGHTATEATRLAEQLCAAIAAVALPHEAAGTAGHVTISAGVASAFAPDPGQALALLQQADAALYAAKQAGRNCVRSLR